MEYVVNLLLDSNKAQVPCTVIAVSLLLLSLSMMLISYDRYMYAQNGRKRKHDGNEQKRAQASQSEPKNHLKSSERPLNFPNGNSAAQPITSSVMPHSVNEPTAKLGDLLYKFDPEKYSGCSEIGCGTIRALFRTDVMHPLQSLKLITLMQMFELTMGWTC